MTEWRCKQDGVLLAIVENGKVNIRYKEVAYTVNRPEEITTECRKCGTKNVLKTNPLKIGGININ